MPDYLEVRLTRVSLRRGENVVLRDISWRIRSGERWLLLGDNGAGKTQLLKLLAGDVWPTFETRGGRSYRSGSEVFCDPCGVRDEIAYVGAERQDKYQRYQWDYAIEQIIGTGLKRSDIPLEGLSRRQLAQIAALVKRFGLADLAGRRFLSLSYGQRRLVLLARAVASRPRLLLLDELFEGLDAERHVRLSSWLARLSRGSMPWVLATHRARDIPSTVTHVASLESGRLRVTTVREARRRLGKERPATGPLVVPVPTKTRVPPRARELVRLCAASVFLDDRRVLRQVSLRIHSGQCWVIHGPNGSGKTTLLRTLYGDYGVSRSAIRRSGIEPGVPLQQFKQRVGWVSASLQSEFPQTMSVAEIVQSGRYASVGLNHAPTVADRKAAQRALTFFKLQHLTARSAGELSYGQLRRVLFARAWVRKLQLLLLDEPFAGVDRGARLALHADVSRSVASGIAVIVSTHHVDEWPTVTTHEIELRNGEAIYSGELRDEHRLRRGAG